MTAPPAEPDPWGRLRGLTPARIGLARTGASLATAPLLDLRLAHARARDAVYTPLDVDALRGALGTDSLCVDSAAPDRRSYLLRPDLGRQLAPGGVAVLDGAAGAYDLVVVVADGLSALAVQTHAPAVLAALLPVLRAQGWRIAPVVIVRQGRVAVGDAVAARLHASAVLMLIGERPGLSAPDSMGAYLTWRPGPGTTDADRNCISNIRPAGLPHVEAAQRIGWMLQAMRVRGVSGVQLKDESDQPSRMIGP